MHVLHPHVWVPPNEGRADDAHRGDTMEVAVRELRQRLKDMREEIEKKDDRQVLSGAPARAKYK